MPIKTFKDLVQEAKKQIRELTAAQVGEKLARGDCFHFIDVREGEDWKEGHARSAVHISKGLIELNIEEEVPDHQAEIILYCGGGSRSALAGESLKRMGYENVISMSGGFRGWRDANLPIEKENS